MNNTLKIKFENTYKKLSSQFYQESLPTKSENPRLLQWNDTLAKEIGINLENDNLETKQYLAQIFSGNQLHPSSEPIATAYAGHQFGHFNPMLGDGRAHLLGELRDREDILHDIQLKGSGPTKFSRSGDGRSPLGPVIREYIVSEAMFYLGVPTTRSLAITETDEKIYREQALKGGILTRVSKSFTRVGTFQYFAAKKDKKSLETLLNYIIKRSFPELDGSQDLALSFFKEVQKKQALLVAKWMGLGFIHGVMNTDNISVLGLTIDYGPCAFMDETNFKEVFSYIDRNGRYAFNNQPKIMQWNLARLAESLLPLYDNPELALIKFQEELVDFPQLYQKSWQEIMLRKVGLKEVNQSNLAILNDWLLFFEEQKIDFTLGFRDLSKIISDIDTPIENAFKQHQIPREHYQEWRELVIQENKTIEQSIINLNTQNPIYIPRNHIIEKIIQEAYLGKYDKLKVILEVIKKPFQERSDFSYYAKGPTSEEKIKNTFCGT